MSKILCDICGTTYPDTEERCPICGYSRDLNGDNILDDPALAADTAEVVEEESVVTPDAPVASVVPAEPVADNRKSRNQVVEEDDDDDDYDDDEDDEEDDDEPRSNTFLVVILVILIVALLAVTGFIFVRYFMPNMDIGGTEATTTAATEATTLPTETTESTIPCTGLVMTSSGSVVLDEEGANWLINVAAYPEDTTDEIVFVSSDESVVTVNEDGKLTAVSEGEAVITITCGSETLECKVTCFFIEETTAPVETTEPTDVTDSTETTEPDEGTEPDETTEPTDGTEPEGTTEPTEAEPDPSVSFTLKKTDVSFWVLGDTWKIQINESGIDHKDVKWSSDNENICTVSEDGVVKITGKGTTTIRGEYKGHKVECIVRSIRNS